MLRALKLAKYLPSLGWQVTVLSSDEARPDQSDAALLDELPPDVRVVRLRGPFRSLGRPIGDAGVAWRERRYRRVIGIFKSLARALFIPDRWIGWSIRAGRLDPSSVGNPEVVVSTGPPHSGHLAGRSLARRAGVPFVADLRDDWAGNPMHASWAPWHEPLDRAFEGATLRAANRIVEISAASAARLSRRRPELADRIVVIPNGFDPDDIGSLPTRSLPANDALRFVYSGSLREVQDVGRFFDVFGRMTRSSGRTLTLTFVGRVDPGQSSRARTAILADAVAFVPPVSHRLALREMAAADVLVVFSGGGGAGSDTMTGKLYEYLALRRPILLVGPAGPAADLVHAAGAGATALPTDEVGIEAAIRRVIEQALDPAFSGAPDDVLRSFNRASQAETWARMLEALAVQGRAPR